MRRPLAALFLLVFVLLIVGTVAFLRSQAAADLLCAQVEARGSELLGGTVLVGRCELDPVRIELGFDEVAIRIPNRGLAIDAAHVRIKLRELQAPSERIRVDALEIDAPVVRLDLDRWLASVPRRREESSPICTLPSLPLEVLEGRVKGGELVLVDEGGERMQVRGLSLSTHDWGENQTFEVDVEEGRARVRGRAIPFASLNLRATMQPDPLAIGVETLSATLGDLGVTASKVEVDPCAAMAKWTIEGEGALPSWFALMGVGGASEAARGAGGRLSLRLSGQGGLFGLKEARAEASFQEATIAGFRVGNAKVRAHLDGDRVVLDEVTTDAMDGRLGVSGSIALLSPYATKLDLVVRKGSLEALIAALRLPGAWVDGRISGSARLEGTLDPWVLDGSADLDLEEFIVLDRPVRAGPPRPEERFLSLPRTHILASVRVLPEVIQIGRGEVRLPHAHLEVAGAFPFSTVEPVRLRGTIDTLDLGADLPRIAQMPYAGQVSGPFSLDGPYTDLRIAGHLGGRGFMVDGLKAGVVTGDVRFEDGTLTLTGVVGQRGRTHYALDRAELYLFEDPKNFVFDITVSEGRLEDIVPALEGWHPLARRFHGARGAAVGTVHVEGPLETVSFDLDGHVTAGEILGQHVDALTLRGGLEQRARLRVDELSGRIGASGGISLRGFAVLDGPLGLSLSLRDLPLEGLDRVEVGALSGQISGDLVVGGTWDMPKVRGGLSLASLRYGEVALGEGRVQVRVDDERLSLHGEIGDGNVAGQIDADLTGPTIALDLRWDERSLERWWPTFGLESVLRGWRGRSRGHVRLSGDPRRQGTWQGSIELGALAVESPRLHLALADPATLEVRDGVVATRGVRVVGGGSELSLRGRAGADAGLDLALEGTLDLGFLAPFVPQIEEAGGQLDLQASLGGALEDPTLVGSGHLHDGELSLADLPFKVTELSGDLTFSQRAIVFEGLTGIAGRGRIDLSGQLRLEHLLPQRLHLVARLDDVRVMPAEGLKLTLAGGLFLDGPAHDLFLSGDLVLVRGRYEADLGVESLLPWAREHRRQAARPAPVPPLRLDVGLRIPGTLRMLTPEVDARIRGDLRLVGTLASPGLLGTAETLQAEAKFRGNRFRVTHAVADFHDADRIAFSFDVNAESEVRDYRVFVHAFGTPEEPRVVLNSDPELAEADLLTLLTLGMTARDAEGLASGEAAFAVMDALFAAAGLDRQVQRFLPDNEILRAPRLHLTSGYSKETGQVQPRVAFESRLFTDRLRLRYSAPIGAAGQRATAEFRITDTISAQAEWDTEDRQSQMGNLGVDIKLRWEME